MRTRLWTSLVLIFLTLAGQARTEKLSDEDRLDSVKKTVLQGPPEEVRQKVAALADSGPLPEKDILELARLLEQQDLVPVAILLLEKQRPHYPRSIALAERLADFYLQNNQSADAAEVLQYLARQRPEKRAYWIRLAEIYTWIDRQEDAIEAYEKAVGLDSSDVETIQALYQLYLWNDRAPQALALQRQLLRLDPENLELWKEYGMQARALGRYVEAIVAFKNILQHDPHNVEAFFLLGETYLWTDRPKEAALCFRQVLQLQPSHTQARFYYSQLQQWQPFGWWEARKNYRQLQAQNAENEETRKALESLRKEYGPLLQSNAQTIHDSNDLTRTEVSLRHERYLSPRLLFLLETRYLQLEEVKPAGRFRVTGEGVYLGATWFLTPRTRFRLSGGGIVYSGGESFALAELQWVQSWGGEFYTTTSAKYDQVLDGVLAVLQKLTAQRLEQTLYWQPSSSFHVGGQFQLSRYSDQNRKIEVYTLGELRFFSGPPALFLQAIYAYQDMSRIYPDAVPYWTPNNFWSRSIGVDAMYPLRGKLSLRGGIGVTQQTGDEVATNWKVEMNWRPSPFASLRLAYLKYGSRFYSYRALQGEFRYRF